MTTPEPDFFLPDGEGGRWSQAKTSAEFPRMRDAVVAESHWPPGSFTGRRAHTLTSRHNGQDYRQVVGELTSDNRFVVMILESLDDDERPRFIVATVTGVIHVDPQKVQQVTYFAEPPTVDQEVTEAE